MTKKEFLENVRTEGLDYAIDELSNTNDLIKYCVNIEGNNPWFFYNGIQLVQLNTVEDVEYCVKFDEEA